MKRACLALSLAALSFAAAAAAAAADSPYDRGTQAALAHDWVGAQAAWQEAAIAGDARAMNQLADLLAKGLGSPPDEIGAVALWLAAADAGLPEAQARLGRAALAGIGMPRDLPMAYARFRCAVEATRRSKPDDAAAVQDAAQGATAAAGQMTDAEAARGARLADECIALLRGADAHTASR